jgi:hypothetical protein
MITVAPSSTPARTPDRRRLILAHTSRLSLVFVAVLVLLTIAGSAAPAASVAAGSAPAPSSQQGSAEALFQEGRSLMSAGRAVEACQKFSESNRLDPATGTLLNLAVCNQAIGKTATAWSQFRLAEVASEADHREDRVTLAREHLAALLPKLSVITIQVPDAQRVPGLKLTLDGQSWGEALWNVPTPIDPGSHAIVAEAPGRVTRSFKASVGVHAQKLLVVVELPPSPGGAGNAPAGSGMIAGAVGARASAAVPTAPPPLGAPSRIALAPPAESGATTARRAPALRDAGGSEEAARPRSLTFTLACVAAGIGASALIVGAVYGTQAFSRWDERNNNCPMDNCTSDAGKQAQIGAENAARDANVAFVVGLAALSAGGYLFYRWRTDDAGSPHPLVLAPAISGQQAGLVLERGW